MDEELLQQLEQFQRCRNNQGYRYVNPYSVLVTREDKLVLLDLEAESNAFVLRNLQKRAMRNHFVKPVVHIRENTRVTLDLYGYGKTIQFILANTEVEPALSKWEENRIARLIDKCLGENSKKLYESFGQVWRDLPAVKRRSGEKDPRMKKWMILFGIVTCLLGLAGWNLQRIQEEKLQMKKQVQLLETELEAIREEQNEQLEAAEEQYEMVEEQKKKAEEAELRAKEAEKQVSELKKAAEDLKLKEVENSEKTGSTEINTESTTETTGENQVAEEP